MAFRYNANGTLEVPARNVDKVCAILERKGIRFQREGNTLRIEHRERAQIPTHSRPEEPFVDIAAYIDKPQSLTVSSDLLGECQVGFVDGQVRTDTSEKVWSTGGEVPTPDGLIESLRQRGIAARVTKVQGSRKSGRRSRVFEIQPGSGGPACRVTIKRRFWDGYDLLSVPDVFDPLCRKSRISPDALRDNLQSAKFGVEVRNPALGGPSADLLYDNLLDIIEEQTEGIRTALG